ncbi:hypothetical protein [Armatimonas sp.]|uniref:hypothetical protein n=1 Tax=Armatimonas sp. TaxID=1872638 RepID=UPI00286AF209|nr:hypothetical protein [Armatimonas sp.]
MSFNDSRVVTALNSLTVPVYLSNDLVKGAEHAALTRIHQEGYAKKLSVGTVHCFLLAPDGTLLDTIHVAKANPPRILEIIERGAQEQEILSGKPLISPQPSALPAASKNELRLHVVARYLEKKPDGSLGIVTGAGGNWSALPGEDWPVFAVAERQALLDGDRGVAERLVTHFYPPTENNNLAQNVIEALEWRAKKLPRGVVQLSGSVTLKHPFYTKDDSRRVHAVFQGYASDSRFELVTTQAQYENLPFAVAVQRG